MTETEEVAVGGDVLLVCGADPGRRIRVFSVVLTIASPVFKTMLGSDRFKEGVELSTKGSVELRLPDDDPDDMLLLCSILHFQHDQVPGIMLVHQLSTFSYLADKYDAGRAVLPTAETWMRAEMLRVTDSERLELLGAAYRMRNADMFESLCTEIILSSSTRIWRGEDEFTAVFDALAKEKYRALDAVKALLDSVIATLGASRLLYGAAQCLRNCTCSETRFQLLVQHLRKTTVWPPLSDQDKASLGMSLSLLELIESGLDMTTVKQCNSAFCIAE